MLSDHERFVLDAIEHEFYDDDPDFADAFRAGRCPRVRRFWHWPSLVLTAAGLVMVAAGLAAGIAPLFIEGVVIAVAGLVYNRWRVRGAADRPARRIRRARHRRRRFRV